ncbi:class I SAM-dependent methyltransferase [Candidatus Daviesbacteria bacterium]|nr:class I SAM-dependent methyltransferase [Candidatus Daviesbacteria bacterium]
MNIENHLYRDHPVLRIQRHLDNAGISYLNSINGTSPESLMLRIQKLSPLARYLSSPAKIASIGVGQGEEIEALHELFGGKVQIIGIDVSKVALKASLDRSQMSQFMFDPILADASNLPLPSHSIDGLVISSVLHEVYSYSIDGIASWKQSIREVTRVLAEDGIFLLRDPAAPDMKEPVILRCLSDFSRSFYDYFREEFRFFRGWNGNSGYHFTERQANNEDYPQLNVSSETMLEFSQAAEVMLHFRNFWNDFRRNTVSFGDIHWKEINESYLVPNPNSTGGVMSIEEYVKAIFYEADQVLGDNNRLICLQYGKLTAPETNTFLAKHFTLNNEDDKNNSRLPSDNLLSQITNKLELVFKKVNV